MTVEEFKRLYEVALNAVRPVGWHWFSYHLHVGPRPFMRSILAVCASIDRRAPGTGTQLLRELMSIGGLEKHVPHYEQLFQKLSEILIIERVVTCEWPNSTSFEYEAAARQGGPRPELLVSTGVQRLVIEVKTPSLTNHAWQRTTRGVQLPYRGLIPREAAERTSGADGLTLPRDNPILDFLTDAERKFTGFREDVNTASLLVIVWDDHIYEPISTLVNQASGLLTENSYARDVGGNARTFPNIDAVIAVRHMNYFIAGAAEHPLMDRQNAMDFGEDGALPNVLFGPYERPIPQMVIDRLRAVPHNDPMLRMFAEYNPHDIVFWS
jgi:hypothetical protein